MNFGRPWFRWTLIASLIVAAGFCSVFYMAWAFAGNATLAGMFLCLFIALETCSVIFLGARLEGPDFDSAGLQFFARYGLALLLCLAATGIIFALIAWSHIF